MSGIMYDADDSHVVEEDCFVDAHATDIHSKTELLGKLVHTFPDYEVWVITNVAQFIENVKSYNFNQALSAEHVTTLSAKIIESKLVIGNLSTCEFNDGTINLIDGHHRLDALKAVLTATSPTFVNAIPLIVFNYRSDEPNSTRTMELFHKINTVKPYTIVKSIDEDCRYIMNTLKEKYPAFKDGIRSTDKSRTCFPYVHANQFKCELENLLKTTFGGKYNRDAIIKQIYEYNVFLSQLALIANGYKDILGTKSARTDAIDKKLDTMKKLGFYLASKMGSNWPNKIKAF